ncbi:MAG: non-homologous end-joining DNA ligase [Chloroflexi bacterium]|nr:non-homologous end-joining DNA ligase [Chloroflexota bacterium]MBU1750440.1 non-homologous end-joining DNA ligase [Chloroflexota bacterium]
MNVTSTTWTVAGRSVSLSHLDKVFWPQDGLTKGDMLRYYQAVAPVMLPYFKDRPVTLRVFPDGIPGFSYYRRDRPDNAPAWLRSVDYDPETAPEVIQLPLVDDAAGLIWLANQGSLEFHLWAARAPDLAEPDQVIIDLDPGDEAPFGDVLQAALRLQEALERRGGLRGYPKTSGGRGLHVYLPLAPGYTFDAVRDWVKDLAGQLAAAHPDLIAVAHGATHRGRQVTIDHAQNSIGRNTAAPYTLRARPGATVSAPLTWDEVADGQVRPSDLTLRTVPDRTQRMGDLFAPVLQAGQHLP